MTIEEFSDLAERLFFTQPALNLLTLGEGNMLAFSSNGVRTRLGVLVRSVLIVVLTEMTLACFELLDTLLCAKKLSHLILRSTHLKFLRIQS